MLCIPVQVIISSKTFTNEVNITLGTMEILGYVNGYDMTTDFLDKISDQTITGKVMFKKYSV